MRLGVSRGDAKKDGLITFVNDGPWSAEAEIMKKQKRSDKDGARLLTKKEGA